MGSVAHVPNGKKDFVKEVHRLARFRVWLQDSSKEVYMVHHYSKSFLVVEVKSKQHIDPRLMKLKKSVFSKFNESFSQEGKEYFGTKLDCVCRMWMV